jgi:PAS domain S-box-containing protein
MIRRALQKRLMFIGLAPAVAVALGLGAYFLALRFSDADAAMALATAATKKHEMLVVTVLIVLVALGAAAVVAWRLARTLAEPMAELASVIDRIREGDYGARAHGDAGGAVGDIATGINDLAVALAAAKQRAADSLIAREEELAHQLGFAQAMLDAQAHAGIGLAVVEYGQIVFANEAVERMSGYTLDELRGLPHFVQIAHPEDRSLIMRDHLQRLAGENSENSYDFSLLRKDQAVRRVQLAQTSISAGKWAQVLCILVDITERKQVEAQLGEAHRALLARNEEAERSSLAKSRFLAAASHDLRQPLHALALFAAELESTAATPDMVRLAGQITTATAIMGELLDALLEVSRLDTADIKPQRQPFALGPLLDSIADAHRQSAAAKGLHLTCVATATWVDSDPHLLRRLVGNLVANAVRYTRQGGIVVGVRRKGAGLRIEIHDTGMGIGAEHLPHIFQEFYQAGNRERDMGKGLGLGLAIVDRIASLLGHRLHVRSTPRHGSVFGVTLPRTAAKLVATPMPLIDAAPRAVRVVVAGTTGAELDSLGRLIRNWGYHVMCAGDESLLRSHMAVMPDIVVCDECLIDSLGRTLAGRPRPRPQVVLVGELPTGTAIPGLFFDGRLAKPVKPGRLRALLHHLLEEAAENAGDKAA